MGHCNSYGAGEIGMYMMELFLIFNIVTRGDHFLVQNMVSSIWLYGYDTQLYLGRGNDAIEILS